MLFFFFFSSRRRHTRCGRDWSSDVCSSDLIRVPDETERRSKAGLVIPATAAPHLKRCEWSEVVLIGPETRNVKPGDRILFLPQTGLEVEIRGETFLLLRERDVQAIASDRDDPHAGQYL